MTLPVGWTLRCIGETASTNTDLAVAAQAGAPEGSALLAGRQHAGRGRTGRAWQSSPGNLHLSLLLRPGCAPAIGGQIGILAALAVADLLHEQGVAVHLKWPNDVLAKRAKLAGILVESALEDDRLAWAVVGIGLNVAAHPEGLPQPATSLVAVLGAGAPSAAELAVPLLGHLGRRYAVWRQEGFAPLRADWLQYGPAPGELARVRGPEGEIRGRFRDLDSDGALVLDLPGAGVRRITAGDVLAA